MLCSRTMSYKFAGSGVALALSIIATNSQATAASYDYTLLNVPGSSDTVPMSINNSGAVAGVFDTIGGFPEGFVYSGGAYTIVNPPGSDYTEVTSISNSGAVAGYFATPPFDGTPSTPTEGFIYSKGAYTIVNPPGAVMTQIFGINDSGAVKVAILSQLVPRQVCARQVS